MEFQATRDRSDNNGLDYLPLDSECARLVHDTRWEETPLGHPSRWSLSLRMMVRQLLANRFPLLLWWGPDYIQIYNDAYAPILGAKHPDQAMGKPFRECWHEVYSIVGPLVDVPFNGGPATWMEDIELVVRRRSFPEESHFTIAYSPVPDDTARGGIGGVLGTVHEITEKVIAERRVAILRELGTGIAAAKSDVEACDQAMKILARYPKDVPFALLYLADRAGQTLNRVSTTGIAAEAAGTGVLALGEATKDVPWPLAEALRTERVQIVDGLSSRLSPAPAGPWPDPPDCAAVVPIRSNIAGQPAGVLVAGISAYIELDSFYRDFLEFVGAQIATAVANTRAYEAERRRAEALAEIDRAKTVFFSNVSHEFRTPLALTLGPLEEVLAAPGLPANVRAQVKVAERNAQRLLKLVNSLLDFARIESGRAEACFTALDLAVLTTELCSTFRSAMERAGLEYDVNCPSLGEPVYVDREMWEKVVLNLLSNAFKFTLQGAVRVRLERDGPHAVLTIADTGVGVPDREMPHLFERFHRVQGTEGRTHEGSGIGLALVQELVKLHGGSIEASSSPGVGTTMRVRIPFGNAHVPFSQIARSTTLASTAIGAHAYVEEALRSLPDDIGSGLSEVISWPQAPVSNRDKRFESTFGARILLVDDNADMRAYLRELLGGIYEVEVVGDGLQALEAARKARPDLILSDVMMPRLDGFGLIGALRDDAQLRDVPVIFLSARAGEESRIDGLAAGVDDYIVKPFHARELLARVGALLERVALRRESDARYRAYVQATSDMIYRMSADWSELRELNGCQLSAERPGPSRSWLQDYIAEEDRPRVMAAVRKAIRGRSKFELEHRVIRSGDRQRWFFSRAIPLFDGHGNLIEWFGAASDITERRETHETLERQKAQLEEADRQKNEFLAMLAHELRNPLAPLRNAGEVLARERVRSPQAGQAIASIERQVTHLTRLVDDLLDVSRISNGRIELRRAPVALKEVVSRALEAVGPLLGQKHLEAKVQVAAEPIVVDGDAERLVQCLGNLLTNAIKFTPPHGEIGIELRADGAEAVVAVSDSGIGIPEELLPKVFDLFVQGECSLERPYGGLGVGLTVVKRLVALHGGRVSVCSDGIDKGATFEIHLPLTAGGPEAIRWSKTPAVEYEIQSCRVLVVDDNRDAASMLAELLKYDGHEVKTAFSGGEALADMDSFHPAIMLLDIGLPDFDGYDLARRIRADRQKAHIRLVAITGYGQEADRRQALTAGFDAHLTKPVEYSKLQGIINRIMADAGADRANT